MLKKFVKMLWLIKKSAYIIYECPLRFQTELEFVQCLGNPNYLNFLAQRGYFKESNFINYLKYLQYWKEPAYVKFVKYPVCLHFLELLQHEAFRKEIVNTQVRLFFVMFFIHRKKEIIDRYGKEGKLVS